MPLSAVDFVPLTGQIKAASHRQFFDLLTGVMTDQPVTLANTLQIGGSQGAGAAPVRINGVAAQTANMMEIRKLTADVQPEFVVGPTGTLAWGPGGAVGTDVTLARSAANQLTLTGLAGTPALVVPVGGIQASGVIDLTGATSVRGIPPQANLLVNGGFDVWQRGTAFGATGIYTADRWIMQTIGTDAFSVTRDTANRDVGSAACAFLSFTLGTGGGSTGIYQQLKTSESQIAGKTISASMRIKTTLANAVRFQLSSDGTGAVAVASGAHTGGGVYQTLTASYAVPADATIVQIQVVLLAGTTQAFYVDNAMLVIGTTPVDYYPGTPADDLARCLRYYQRFDANATTGAMLAVGYCISATQAIVMVPMLAKMGGNPTLTVSAAAQFTVASSSNQACTTLVAFNLHPDHFTLLATVAAGLVAGQGCMLQVNTAAAWLALEWNP